ncbi:MAG TPA: HAMP domain-containing sensor histidine kinase [Baekduia sp.]|uniref:sensor histidine kinase n=1 Tax=Baekduia sp. TaxID=2600305 RepID=UPI002C07F7F8|nr:HAMP domain-containing sensor histidine kinase [Baekduia sp.]HMJ33522.1 HAMP domain-containing sensor histidine kinase [Baekduia sp.]
MTIRRRLVLLSAVAVAMAIAIASAAVYVLVRSGLRAEVDTALRQSQNKAYVVGAGAPSPDELLGPLPGKKVDEVVRVALPSAKFGDATGIAQLVTRKGSVVASVSGGSPLPTSDLGSVPAIGKAALSDRHVKGVHLRMLNTRLPSGEVLMVARPLTEVDRTLRSLLWVLLAVTLGGIALAAGLGVLVARGTLRPLRRMTASAEQVAATQDLSHRLPEGGRDEIDRLGASFNQMLSALEASREAQRQLVADASHELRTPLTSVRTNVELLARAPDLPGPERERIVTSVGSQIQELAVLVGDLVDLARPNGIDPEEIVEDVRLDLVVADAVEAIRDHAPGHAFAVDAQPCTVSASRPRLHRAVRNLLDNAVKWSPPGAAVEVVVGDGEVTVRDHGPGIADEDLPHVFDRFYRAPAARRLPGSGLGLAIVRQVAEAYGGTVVAERAETGGARLRLRLSPTS